MPESSCLACLPACLPADEDLLAQELRAGVLKPSYVLVRCGGSCGRGMLCLSQSVSQPAGSLPSHRRPASAACTPDTAILLPACLLVCLPARLVHCVLQGPPAACGCAGHPRHPLIQRHVHLPHRWGAWQLVGRRVGGRMDAGFQQGRAPVCLVVACATWLPLHAAICTKTPHRPAPCLPACRGLQAAPPGGRQRRGTGLLPLWHAGGCALDQGADAGPAGGGAG